ncbi:hypothetical protein BJ508DRAFT_170 [Ascobolus immersus RN42]|uniref:Uncharacterized protein n=1 Tax=Ascobolus immersus RN42 TaxID=1160509 RepID=A0A3N4IT34_ASCIM|nr:hypothetical protein BJ508DRAFT_170 [Ascobolus immersus RN42]
MVDIISRLQLQSVTHTSIQSTLRQDNSQAPIAKNSTLVTKLKINTPQKSRPRFPSINVQRLHKIDCSHSLASTASQAVSPPSSSINSKYPTEQSPRPTRQSPPVTSPQPKRAPPEECQHNPAALNHTRRMSSTP